MTIVSWLAFSCWVKAYGGEEALASIEENRTTLRAGKLVAVFEKLPTGVRLERLEVPELNLQLAGASPLVEITLRELATRENRTLGLDVGWDNVQIRWLGDERFLEIRLAEPAAEFPTDLTVVLQVHPRETESSLGWHLEVSGVGAAHSLWSVQFPVLVIPELSADAVLIYPKGVGVAEAGVWRRSFQFGGRYPSGWMTMQMGAAYRADGSGGIYVGLHDPWASTKEMQWRSDPREKLLHFAAEHWVPDMGRPGVAFDLPGEVVLRFFTGDWFDAAQIYRRWVEQESRWWPELGEAGREDTPLWMRELPLWILGGGAPSECVPSVLRFQQGMGVPCGFHWYNWHQIPFDNDYPHYFPTKEGFAEGVQQLQQNDVHVMPYINGRLWDTRDGGMEDYEFSQVARPAATKNHEGEPFVETYGSKEADGSPVRLAVMCPTTKLWQERVQGLVGRLFKECGTHGVYIDQVAAAAPTLCADPGHGHPLGGGHWWTEGYWAMLAEIRRDKPQDRMITTECNAEPFVRWFDGYLTWHWQYDNQVPLFPAVYAGAVQMFGRWFADVGRKNFPNDQERENHDRALRMKFAQALVFGEQLGWINPPLIDEAENAAFVWRLAQLRWQFRPYFYAGRMGRPPKVEGEIPRLTADWKWGGKSIVTMPAVLSAQWILGQKRQVLIVVVNASTESIPVRLAADLGEAFPDARTALVTGTWPEGNVSAQVEKAAFRAETTVAGLTARAWEISVQ
jgi:hypothetical protein